MNNLRRCVLLLSIFGLLFYTSCANYRKEFSRIDGRYGYDCSGFFVPYEDSTYLYITDVLRFNNVNYVVAFYDSTNEDPDKIKIFEVNDAGELLKTNEILSTRYYGAPQTAIIDEKLGLVNNENGIDLYDTQDFSVSQTLYLQDEAVIVSMYDMDDGYVVCSPGRITRYFDNGSEPVEVSDSLLSVYGSDQAFFETDGHYYALIRLSSGCCYCEIDFSAGTVTELEKPMQVIRGAYDCRSDYIFSRDGIYRVNLIEKNAAVIVDWDSVDIRPEYKYLSDEQYVINDDDHFAKIYSYMDGTAEILFFSYNSNIDNSGRIPITVGGYNLNFDLSLKWGIYSFNTSQDEYRMVTDDYTEKFGWTDAVDAQRQTAALIQYFSEGNAPDIFYGDFFDYETLGNMNSVLDLRSFMAEDHDFSWEDLYFPTYDRDHEIYSLYSAFNTGGMFAKADVFEGNNEVSISMLDEAARETGITPMAPQFSANIVDSGIRYSLHDMAENRTGDHVVAIEDLTEIIDFSVRYGVSDFGMVRFALIDDVDNDQYLLGSDFINDVYTYEATRRNVDSDLIYVGYPSIEGSVHLITPYGLTAISSSSQYPDACWAFVKCMLSEDIQKVLTANMMIPVSQPVLQSFVYYTVHPEELPHDEVAFRSMIMLHEPVAEDIAEQYLEDIGSLDTLQLLDWGVYNIIVDEVTTYDTQGKAPEEIAESLAERLDLYVEENY